jgi:hypothetical protein
MTLETMCAQQARFIKQQTELIEHQKREIARLTHENNRLREENDLDSRYINEIYRKHFEMGGAAMNIELERIADNGTPIELCYTEIPNGEYYTIVRVRT